MLRYVLILFVLISGPVYADDCEFRFKVDNGKVYGQSEIVDFVENEIRSRLSREQTFFDTVVQHVCDSESQEITITMESVALYIEKINGVELSEDVARYTDDNVELSSDSYSAAFKDATNFSNLTQKQQQDVVKHFAFLVAETARFEDIENAANMILNDACSYDWVDYMDLVRRWKTMSIFVNSQGLAKGTQYLGGWRAFLIAPITSDDVKTYNKATQDGWKVVRWTYGEPRIIDTASPISVGEGLCPK